MRLLVAAAALFVATITSHCLAQSDTVIIALSGTIQPGKSLSVTSGTETIMPAEVYYYSITGTCHGTGGYASFISPGTDLATLIGAADPAMLPYLQGAVLDPSGKLPFVCVNKTALSRLRFSGITIFGSAHSKIGITKTGVCYGQINNVNISITGLPPLKGGIAIDEGQLLVQVFPFGGALQPNLSFMSAVGHLDGLGVTGTDAVGHSENISLKKGKTAHYTVVLWNAGSTAGSFTLNASPVDSGFTEKFIYQRKDVTAAVTTGSSGFTVPPTGTLAGGAAATLTWQVTNKNAATGDVITPVLTATPTISGTYEDALVISGTAH